MAKILIRQADRRRKQRPYHPRRARAKPGFQPGPAWDRPSPAPECRVTSPGSASPCPRVLLCTHTLLSPRARDDACLCARLSCPLDGAPRGQAFCLIHCVLPHPPGPSCCVTATRGVLLRRRAGLHRGTVPCKGRPPPCIIHSLIHHHPFIHARRHHPYTFLQQGATQCLHCFSCRRHSSEQSKPEGDLPGGAGR